MNKRYSSLLLALSIISCIPYTVHAFFGGSDNAGSNFAGGALTGAAIGGIAGGRRGAGYGALAGGMLGLATTRPNERDNEYNRNYNNGNTGRRGYNPNSRSSMRQYIADLEDENQQLRDENYQLMRELNARRQR